MLSFFASLSTAPADSSPEPAEPPVLDAIREAVAYIEFNPRGQVLDANDRFLETVGHAREDVIGQHHRMFCSPEYARSIEYQAFWRRLQNGESHTGTFPRVTRAGETIWLEATYFPVRDAHGQVEKVAKIAYDVTEKHEQLRDQEAIFSALDRSMAVIEFTPNGEIIRANENFLRAVGYELDAIRGHHHRIFCDEDFYRDHPDFWERLARGQFMSGKFRRLKANGEELWLEATYNPILDAHGRVEKVIKFATDITASVHTAERTREATSVAHEMAQKTADHARHGAESLQQNAQHTEQIRAEVTGTQEAVERLNAEARNIESIIETIRTVAETTRMLSLNAAIEAARAGEQGRGFAVVAQEVRKLAANTSEATTRIAEVINGNLERTREIGERISTVRDVAEQADAQVQTVQGIVDEIREGANRVVESVSSIPREGR
ncbi:MULTISPECIES: PAS domain S-box protein [unclassified Thioalkalivibrio]|uniref:methyl-accepting chemotaxis protein n=1 Tax=unclassified Thioalkalivibrio TaxID=2621013 RepID=UPI00036008CD|nr:MULTISPECIES: PAS domain S-box protein [unclassified Thioalkalivibrio]